MNPSYYSLAQVGGLLLGITNPRVILFLFGHFFNEIGVFISCIFETEEPRLKITVCLRHRYLFGTRWRWNSSRCSIPTEVAAHKGKSSAPEAQYGLKRGVFSPCYERHEYACTRMLAYLFKWFFGKKKDSLSA